jgi:multisubunit Na+/H+ antiporter MnhB subunit
MTTAVEVAKGILLFCCGYFLSIAIAQAMSGQLALAAFMLVGFSIPLTYFIYGYVKEKQEKAKSTTSQWG